MESALFTPMFPKAIGTFALMAACETCLGFFRIKVLSRHLEKPTVERVGVLSAIASVLGISYALIDWIRPETRLDLARIGTLWYGSMVGFDVLIGRLRGASWAELEQAFNPLKGGYLGLYMSVLFAAPFIAYGMRHGHSSHP
jgi:hypothetical protein